MEKRDKSPAEPELKRRIEELIAGKGGGHNSDLVADVVENALKLLHDVEDRGDVRVIQTSLRELRYAFKLFAPYAHKRFKEHTVRFTRLWDMIGRGKIDAEFLADCEWKDSIFQEIDYRIFR